MQTEESLLERIAAGDRSAVARCIDRYGGLVWSLARRALRVEADAEEAVQDVFTELWAKADQYDAQRCAEATWVSMIARRRIVDRLRRAGREPDQAEDDALLSLPAPRDGCSLEHESEAQRVLRAMRALGPEQYRVLHMSIWLGLSHAEVAARTALPIGTVKSHLRRGLRTVRATLGISEGEES